MRNHPRRRPAVQPGGGGGGRCKWDTQPRGGRSPPGSRVPRGAARGSPADGGGARPGGAPGAGPEPAWAERCGPAESAGGCRRGLRTVRRARPPLPRSVPSGRSRPAATASEAGAASRCPARGRGARSPRSASAVPGVALGVRTAHGHARAPRVRGRRTGRWALKLPRAAHRAQHLPGAPTRCPARPGGHTALTFGRPPPAPAPPPPEPPGTAARLGAAAGNRACGALRPQPATGGPSREPCPAPRALGLPAAGAAAARSTRTSVLGADSADTAPAGGPARPGGAAGGRAQWDRDLQGVPPRPFRHVATRERNEVARPAPGVRSRAAAASASPQAEASPACAVSSARTHRRPAAVLIHLRQE